MIKVNNSQVHGHGIFSTSDIPKNTVVLESPFINVTGCSGEIEKYYFGMKEVGHILPLDRGALINHSDEPNLKFEITKDKIIFTSLSDVKKGKELFINYGRMPN